MAKSVDERQVEQRRDGRGGTVHSRQHLMLDRRNKSLKLGAHGLRGRGN
jgi:hypothetical protein